MSWYKDISNTLQLCSDSIGISKLIIASIQLNCFAIKTLTMSFVSTVLLSSSSWKCIFHTNCVARKKKFVASKVEFRMCKKKHWQKVCSIQNDCKHIHYCMVWFGSVRFGSWCNENDCNWLTIFVLITLALCGLIFCLYLWCPNS